MRITLKTLAIIILFFAGSACAELQINLEGLTDSIRIGDPLELRLTIEAPMDGQLLIPDLPAVMVPFELLTQPQTSALSAPDESRLLEISFDATCYETGDQVFPPIPAKWISEDGEQTDSVATEPHIIHIQGVVPQEILAIADSTQQPYHLLQQNRARKIAYSVAEFIPWALIILAAISVFFLIRWLIRRRKRDDEEVIQGPPPRPPYEIAMEELDKLRDRKLYQSGEIKLYYSELSEIIRRYIEGRFGVPAMESTSFQLMRDIEIHLSNRNLESILESLLADADLAKFAKHRPDEDTCRKDLENTYILVNRTKPEPKPILSEEAA